MTEITEDSRLVTALVRVTHEVNVAFAEASREYGLTAQQNQMLCRLVVRPDPVGMSELCQMLHLEKSSLTGMIDRVERRGLVNRVPDGRDRRAYRIALTEAGVDLSRAAHRAVSKRLEELGDHLPPAERELLVTLMSRMLDPADSPTDGDARGSERSAT